MMIKSKTYDWVVLEVRRLLIRTNTIYFIMEFGEQFATTPATTDIYHVACSERDITRFHKLHPGPAAPLALSTATLPSSCTPASYSACLRCTSPTLWLLCRRHTGPEDPRLPRQESGFWRRCRPTYCCLYLPKWCLRAPGDQWQINRLKKKKAYAASYFL